MKTHFCYAAETWTTTATAHQNPDKISRNRRDRDTHTTGSTLTTVAPAFEGSASSGLRPLPRPTTPTHTRYLALWKNMSQALLAHL